MEPLLDRVASGCGWLDRSGRSRSVRAELGGRSLGAVSVRCSCAVWSTETAGAPNRPGGQPCPRGVNSGSIGMCKKCDGMTEASVYRILSPAGLWCLIRFQHKQAEVYCGWVQRSVAFPRSTVPRDQWSRHCNLKRTQHALHSVYRPACSAYGRCGPVPRHRRRSLPRSADDQRQRLHAGWLSGRSSWQPSWWRHHAGGPVRRRLHRPRWPLLHHDDPCGWRR